MPYNRSVVTWMSKRWYGFFFCFLVTVRGPYRNIVYTLWAFSSSSLYLGIPMVVQVISFFYQYKSPIFQPTSCLISKAAGTNPLVAGLPHLVRAF